MRSQRRVSYSAGLITRWTVALSMTLESQQMTFASAHGTPSCGVFGRWDITCSSSPRIGFRLAHDALTLRCHGYGCISPVVRRHVRLRPLPCPLSPLRPSVRRPCPSVRPLSARPRLASPSPNLSQPLYSIPEPQLSGGSGLLTNKQAYATVVRNRTADVTEGARSSVCSLPELYADRCSSLRRIQCVSCCPFNNVIIRFVISRPIRICFGICCFGICTPLRQGPSSLSTPVSLRACVRA